MHGTSSCQRASILAAGNISLCANCIGKKKHRGDHHVPVQWTATPGEALAGQTVAGQTPHRRSHSAMMLTIWQLSSCDAHHSGPTEIEIGGCVQLRKLPAIMDAHDRISGVQVEPVLTNRTRDTVWHMPLSWLPARCLAKLAGDCLKCSEGWQTAGLDAHKKPLMWPWGACWLRDEACQENVSAFEGFEACNAWRTAGWTAQKKRWMWPWGSFCLRGWAFREAFAKGWQTAGLDAHKKPLMWPWGACWLRIRHAKRMFKRLKGLIRHAKRMFKRLKGLKRVTPGERQAGPPHWCGLGVACLTAKKPLMWPWGFCVRGWACNAVTREGCGGKRQADQSCREALKHLKLRKTSSTPAVVPGAAPALAKAGVGGHQLVRFNDIQYP